MDNLTFILIALAVILFSFFSNKLKISILTPPLIFTAFGLLLGDAGLGVLKLDFGQEGLHLLAEVTLILVLFSDAARIDLKLLKKEHNLPIRILGIGLPLTILFGTVAAFFLPLGLAFWEAALLAAVLAPTDAALGQSVVSSPNVPVRIRQTLNIESGLNDGIALPVVLVLAAIVGSHEQAQGVQDWILFGTKQVTLGPLAGIVIGTVGAFMINFSSKRGWMGKGDKKMFSLFLAFLAYSGAEMIGGNGFISAFVAGAVFGNMVKEHCHSVLRFATIEGHMLTLFTFLILGAAFLAPTFENLNGTIFLYSILSLTVIRMVPVGLSLVGTRLKMPTVGFLGWFGPRGLASILFSVFVFQELDIPAADTILSITFLTVALSILLHGITAAPAAKWYGDMVKKMGECEETNPVSELPTRSGEGLEN